MNVTRTFLLVNTVVLVSYGLYCLFVPSFLGEAAGIIAQTPTGLTELRAMYGGLQIGAGLLLLAGLLSPRYTVTALVTPAFLFAGLAIARSIGIALDSSISAYTLFALIYEITATAIALSLLRQTEEYVEG